MQNPSFPLGSTHANIYLRGARGGNLMRRRHFSFSPCGAMDTHLRGYDAG